MKLFFFSKSWRVFTSDPVFPFFSVAGLASANPA